MSVQTNTQKQSSWTQADSFLLAISIIALALFVGLTIGMIMLPIAFSGDWSKTVQVYPVFFFAQFFLGVIFFFSLYSLFLRMQTRADSALK